MKVPASSAPRTAALAIPLTPREKVIAAVTLGVVIAAIVFRVLVLPAYRHWAGLREQEQSIEQRLAHLRSNLAQSQNLEQALLIPVNGAGDSDQIVMSIILRELEQAARSRSFRLQTVKPLPVEVQGNLGIYRVQASGTGDLSECVRLVDRMTATPGSGLEDFSIRAARGSSGATGGGVDATITFKSIRVRGAAPSSTRGTAPAATGAAP